MPVAPYGTWSSPITADAILAGSISIDAITVDPKTSTVYHLEKLPSGSNTLVNTTSRINLLKDGEWDVRTGVHEYGGGAAIVYGGVGYFSNKADGRIYAVKEGEKAKAVTPESSVYRYANLAVHPTESQLLVGVIEDHTNDTPQTIVNSICIIDTAKSSISITVSGADFYSSPVFTPDGSKLAWISWDHPDMPWEGSELHVADMTLTDGAIALSNIHRVAGEKTNISVSYPSWISNDTLVFTSDKSGFVNPWIYSTSSKSASAVFTSPIDEDFGDPAWRFADYPYAPLSPTSSQLLFFAYRGGRTILYLVDTSKKGSPKNIDCPFVTIRNMSPAGEGKVVFFGQTSAGPGAIILVSISDDGQPTFTTLKSTELPGSILFPPELISKPQPITLHPKPSNLPLHIVFYPPTNPSYTPVKDEKPPCVISVHGGPTGVSKQAMTWTVQYYTSRGWAWVDVNYGGSSGFGREYISRLAGNWGVVDTADCLTAAKLLAQPPYSLIDSTRTVIRGGSAGGYTVLAALSLPNIDNEYWATATSSYGISNLRLLAGFTHKFELRYMEKLMGGTLEEKPKVYDEERSPLFHAEKIKKPLLILQGSIDRVVPPEQSRAIAASIEKRGGKVKYVEYEGEGHGWRKDANIRSALEEEMQWYVEVLGLKR